MYDCTCQPIWSANCLQHGIDSKWWNSPLQVERRREQKERETQDPTLSLSRKRREMAS